MLLTSDFSFDTIIAEITAFFEDFDLTAIFEQISTFFTDLFSSFGA